MKKIVYIVLVLSLIFAIAACGSNKKAKPVADGVPQYFPQWWNDQKENDYVCSYGMGTTASETASINTAKANAFQEAAQFVGVEVTAMLRAFESEAGVIDPQVLRTVENAVEVVSQVEFKGAVVGKTETIKTKETGALRYKTWVQLKIPKAEIEKSLLNHIQNEEALYNEFKASQAFERMEKRVGGY